MTISNVSGVWKGESSISKYVFKSDNTGKHIIALGQEPMEDSFIWEIRSPNLIHLVFDGGSQKGLDLTVRMISNEKIEIDGSLYTRMKSDVNKSDSQTFLRDLFLHPLGIKEDIRIVHPLKFEGYLQRNGIAYTKHNGYDNSIIFSLKYSVLISGVKLPLAFVSFNGSNVVINYDSTLLDYKENVIFREKSVLYAETLAEAFRKAGFDTYVAAYRDIRDYEAFRLDGDTHVRIEVDPMYGDISLGAVLKKK